MPDFDLNSPPQYETALAKVGWILSSGKQTVSTSSKQVLTLPLEQIIAALNKDLDPGDEFREVPKKLFSETVDGDAHYLGRFFNDQCMQLFIMDLTGDQAVFRRVERDKGEPLSSEATMRQDLARRSGHSRIGNDVRKKMQTRLARKVLTTLLANEVGDEIRRDVLYHLGCPGSAEAIPQAISGAKLNTLFIITGILENRDRSEEGN